MALPAAPSSSASSSSFKLISVFSACGTPRSSVPTSVYGSYSLWQVAATRPPSLLSYLRSFDASRLALSYLLDRVLQLVFLCCLFLALPNPFPGFSLLFQLLFLARAAQTIARFGQLRPRHELYLSDSSLHVPNKFMQDRMRKFCLKKHAVSAIRLHEPENRSVYIPEVGHRHTDLAKSCPSETVQSDLGSKGGIVIYCPR